MWSDFSLKTYDPVKGLIPRFRFFAASSAGVHPEEDLRILSATPVKKGEKNKIKIKKKENE